MHNFDPSILRKYDIRGVYTQTLHNKDAYALGNVFAQTFANKKDATIVVACDKRPSSFGLKKELMRGMTDAGVRVLDIGVGPTPFLYLATKYYETDGGVMITGSHNPENHNGFKLLNKEGPVFGDQIKKITQANLIESVQKGDIKTQSFAGAYMTQLLMLSELTPDEAKEKIVWDYGNGATGEVLKAFIDIYGLEQQNIVLESDADDFLSNRYLDPSRMSSYSPLIEKMRLESANLGFLFDPDGDRLGVVLDGEVIMSDQIIAILALDHLMRLKDGADKRILLDVKASMALIDLLKASGAEIIFSQTGHSLIKEKMQQDGISFAAEMSGHIYYGKNHNFDDALLAAFDFMRIFKEKRQLIYGVLSKWPETYLSPEMRIPYASKRKDELLETFRKIAVDLKMRIIDIDGIRA